MELFVWSDMKPLWLYCKALSPPPPSECSHRSAASLQNQQASDRWGLSPLFFQAISTLSSEVSKCQHRGSLCSSSHILWLPCACEGLKPWTSPDALCKLWGAPGLRCFGNGCPGGWQGSSGPLSLREVWQPSFHNLRWDSFL